MPETIEQIMKEKVQKLEKVLRAREERIMALETENAMLYLRLAECQGSMRSCRNETTHLKRLYENDEDYIQNTKNSIKSLNIVVKDLKKELNDLRRDATKLPKMIMFDFDTARNKAIKQLEFFSSSQSSDIRVLQGQLLEKDQLLDEALHRAASEKDRRRTLHNTIIEIRGNIRVHCRIRPLIGRLDSPEDESQLGKKGTPSEQVVHCFDEETVEVIPSKPVGGRIEKKMFEYERVYGVNDSQTTVFKDVGPLLTSLLDGYNVCIMAYGQTGSGKTHTMLGRHEYDVDVDPDHPIHDEGIIPRAIRELFRLMNERESRTETFTVEVSLAEIYVNEVKDLLAGRLGQNEKMKQEIVTNAEGSIELPSLHTQVVSSMAEVMNLVFWGMTHRHEDATKVHAHSSRSHLIVQVNIYTTTNQSPPLKTQKSVDDSTGYMASPPGTPRGTRKNMSQLRSPSPNLHNRRRSKYISKSDLVTRSPAAPRSRSPSPPGSGSSSTSTATTVKTKLQLVDLAGSECVGMSGVTGQGLRETSHINKSLSALADVLGALSEHRSHIPYRNTKLTHILQDTIGGDAKLMVMLCVSPAQRYITESLQCLGFGTRARQVARGEAKKRKPMVWQQGQVSIDMSQVNAALKGGNSGNLSPRTLIPQRKRLQSLKNSDIFNHY